MNNDGNERSTHHYTLSSIKCGLLNNGPSYYGSSLFGHPYLQRVTTTLKVNNIFKDLKTTCQASRPPLLEEITCSRLLWRVNVCSRAPTHSKLRNTMSCTLHNFFYFA
jgi:hypothetical protein